MQIYDFFLYNAFTPQKTAKRLPYQGYRAHHLVLAIAAVSIGNLIHIAACRHQRAVVAAIPALVGIAGVEHEIAFPRIDIHIVVLHREVQMQNYLKSNIIV